MEGAGRFLASWVRCGDLFSADGAHGWGVRSANKNLLQRNLNRFNTAIVASYEDACLFSRTPRGGSAPVAAQRAVTIPRNPKTHDTKNSQIWIVGNGSWTSSLPTYSVYSHRKNAAIRHTFWPSGAHQKIAQPSSSNTSSVPRLRCRCGVPRRDAH